MSEEKKEVVLMDITDIAKYMDDLTAAQKKRDAVIKILSSVIIITSVAFAWSMSEKQDEINSINSSIVKHEEALLTQNSKIDMTIDTVVANKEELNRTAQRLGGVESGLESASKNIQSVSKKVAAQASQISKIQKGIEAGPQQTVVIAATDDQAKKAAFDRWTQQNPDWKEYRGCIRNAMGSNPSVSLNDAYKNCKGSK